MSKKPKNLVSELLGKPVDRRKALRGIGALAVAGPAAAACSSEDTPATQSVTGTGGSSPTGGNPSTGGASPTGGSTPSGAGPGTGGAGPSTGGTAQTTGGTAQTTGGTAQTTGGTAQATGGTAQTSGGAGGEQGGSGGNNSSGAPNAGAGGGGGSLVAPPWDDVPMCTASKTDGAGQGPFFIHDKEVADDIDFFRQDIRGRYNMTAEPGIELQLHLRILSSKSTTCNMMPVADADIYIWHTDAQGYYSGFGNPGDQKPDEPYAGVPGQNDLDNPDRFCRGAQVTDANGVVSFRSIFPGWYNGRDLHIHFVALKKGSMSRGRMMYSGAEHLFTTQFYFDPALSDMVHKSTEPYLRRTTISAYEGAIKADENGNSNLRAKATFSNDIVVAQMQILLDPKT
jgi:protocatechuate 3,4-dioxygenase beta subunit